MAELLLLNAAAVLAAVTALWLLSLALHDASIVDIFWGPGFVLIAWVSHALVGDGATALLLAGLASLWGLRLGLFLAWRNIGHGEDFRYRAMREKAGQRFWWVSYFQVFALQGAIMLLVGLPLMLGQYRAPAEPGALALLGAAIGLSGILFEAIGDWQLARFKADPANRGQVMESGLWGWTRHPNYFGNALLWWGLYLVACSAPYGWLALPGPAIMTFLLMRVSGVAMLERTLSQTKPRYADYMRRVPAFFPRPPRAS